MSAAVDDVAGVFRFFINTRNPLFNQGSNGLVTRVLDAFSGTIEVQQQQQQCAIK